MAKNLGVVSCPLCGCGAAKAAESGGKHGYPYIVCPPAHDGGCNSQLFGRSPKAAAKIAGRVTKWADQETKAKYAGAESAPMPKAKGVARATSPRSKVAEPAPKKSFLASLLEEDDE